jgi:hypothetical protein
LAGATESAATSPAGGAAGVIVLGMSRSGTSLLTEVFNRAGFYVGGEDDLLAADDSNPRGYFENLHIHDENERLLAEFGGSWLRPPPAEWLLAHGDRTTARLREILEQMRGEAADAPIAVKDPRIGVLLPVWKPAFQDVLHPVIAVRDPVEVAMSLARRDLTPIPVVMAAWEVHMTALLGGLRGESVTVVQYAELIERPDLPERIVNQVSERLDPGLRRAVDPARGAEAREPKLWRNRAGAEAPGSRLTQLQEELWKYLSGLPSGPAELDPPERFLAPSRASLDAIAGESERIATVERLKGELLEARGEHREMEAELRASRAEVQRLTTILQAVHRSNTWRMTRPLRDAGTRLRRVRRSG